MPPPLHSLLQAAATAIATSNDALSTHLVQGAVALILALQAWVIRAVTTTRDEVREITQAVFGVNRDNGIDGDVKDLKERVAHTEAYIANTVPERLKLWEAFKKETEDALSAIRQKFERQDDDRRTGPSDRRQHP
jgi:hypothetical protein